MRKPGLLAGALCGALITAALLGTLFLAHALLGLPFPPFQLFDRISRMLPGRLITTGIDSMVAVIRRLNIGETSTVAKTAEQLMAVFVVLLAGSVLGALFFLLRRESKPGRWKRVGVFVGLLIGLPMALIAATSSQQGLGGPLGGAAWALLSSLCWGMLLSRTHDRLLTIAAVESGQLEVERLDRRTFLIRLAGATATITVAGAVVGALLSRRGRSLAPGEQPWSATHTLPNAGATVMPARGTRPEFTPVSDHYRIDINTIAPSVDENRWRLEITGMVGRPASYTLAQLRAYEPIDQFITLACISNPIGGDLIGTQRWTGVSLQKVVPEWGLLPGATHLRIHSVDGFFEVVPLEVIMADPRVMLAYAWDGLPLEQKHGFPLRIYLPDHYGMKQPKWIERIEAIGAWQPGYWVERGWDREARMRATSVIDTIASDMMIVEQGRPVIVPIGGIAHAGARGISKVEVSVDDGSWQPALLRTPLSSTTWVLWRYDWPFQAGKHTFTVRCYEGDGTPQIETDRPMRPSGATGLDSKTQMM